MSEKDDKKKRRPYREPRVERIEIRLDEAMLGNCKNPGWGGCAPPGQPPSRRPGS